MNDVLRLACLVLYIVIDGSEDIASTHHSENGFCEAVRGFRQIFAFYVGYNNHPTASTWRFLHLEKRTLYKAIADGTDAMFCLKHYWWRSC